jgi:hypothetical protein
MSRTPSITAGIEMRCAGHVSTAIQDVCALSRTDAEEICNTIPLTWDADGCYVRPRARAHAPVPA